MSTYLGVPIFDTVWKSGTNTLTFKKKAGITHYISTYDIWHRWDVDDQTVLNHLKLHNFHPLNTGYTPNPNPIINKIREMEARRKPIYTVENQHAQI